MENNNEDKPKKSKLERIVIFSMISIAVIVAFGLISVYALPGLTGNKIGSGNTAVPNSESTPGNGDVQLVTLSFDTAGYVITPNTLKVGVPVKMTVDTNTVTGCMRDVVIKDFGVRKYITPEDNVIEFTPDKTGTFLIACSMNMGRGYFSVTSDGTASVNSAAQLQAQTAQIKSSGTAGTCGSPAASGASGGCGCGMMK
jgi:uncharacterized protein